jgi:hypothetical protein
MAKAQILRFLCCGYESSKMGNGSFKVAACLDSSPPSARIYDAYFFSFIEINHSWVAKVGNIQNAPIKEGCIHACIGLRKQRLGFGPCS